MGESCQWALAQKEPPFLIRKEWRMRLWVLNSLGEYCLKKVWEPYLKKRKKKEKVRASNFEIFSSLELDSKSQIFEVALCTLYLYLVPSSSSHAVGT